MILENLVVWYDKYLAVIEKAKKQNKNAILKEYVPPIVGNINLFEKTSEEIYIESLMETAAGIGTGVVLNESDYQKIIEALEMINKKMLFLIEYQKKTIDDVKYDIETINEMYIEIANMDFSIIKSLEKLSNNNIPLKKVIDYKVINAYNCDINDNVISFNSFGVEPISSDLLYKDIDSSKHSISISFKSGSENIYSILFNNTKTADKFIINIKQNNKIINIVPNMLLDHNCIIEIGKEQISEITIYSEADISNVFESIIVNKYGNINGEKKGYFIIETTNIEKITKLFMYSRFDYEIFLFDLSMTLDYNVDYYGMKEQCDNLQMSKIELNEVIDKYSEQNLGFVILFNTEKFSDEIVDIFYE